VYSCRVLSLFKSYMYIEITTLKSKCLIKSRTTLSWLINIFKYCLDCINLTPFPGWHGTHQCHHRCTLLTRGLDLLSVHIAVHHQRHTRELKCQPFFLLSSFLCLKLSNWEINTCLNIQSFIYYIFTSLNY